MSPFKLQVLPLILYGIIHPARCALMSTDFARYQHTGRYCSGSSWPSRSFLECVVTNLGHLDHPFYYNSTKDICMSALVTVSAQCQERVSTRDCTMVRRKDKPTTASKPATESPSSPVGKEFVKDVPRSEVQQDADTTTLKHMRKTEENIVLLECSPRKTYLRHIERVRSDKWPDHVTEYSTPVYMTAATETSFSTYLFFPHQAIFLRLFHYSDRTIKDINLEYVYKQRCLGIIQAYVLLKRAREDTLYLQEIQVNLPENNRSSEAVLTMCGCRAVYTFKRHRYRASYHSFVVNFRTGSVQMLSDSEVRYFTRQGKRTQMDGFFGQTWNFIFDPVSGYIYWTRINDRAMYIHSRKFKESNDYFAKVHLKEILAMGVKAGEESLYMCCPGLGTFSPNGNLEGIEEIFCEAVAVRGKFVVILTEDKKLLLLSVDSHKRLAEFNLPRLLQDFPPTRWIFR